MDNLARNAMLAKQAGMSYGRWKAMQEPVKPKPKPLQSNEIKCLNCGRVLLQSSNRHRKYCDSYCGLQYRYNLSHGKVKKGVTG